MKLTFTTIDGRKAQINFKVSGYSYSRKKEAARELAVNVQNVLAECVLYQSQAATIEHIMENIGRKFGLLSEFRENGIC